MSEERTRHEVLFIVENVPPTNNTKVLDIACGKGRHSKMLAAYGYDVLGIDSDPYILREARLQHPTGRYIELDMRDLSKLSETNFDIILIMWQSWGQFEDSTNQEILEEIYDKLLPGGVFLIDIYNPDFFEKHQGTHQMKRENIEIQETKFVKNQRLYVELLYPDDPEPDHLEWRLYSQQEFVELIEEIGFEVHLICTKFDSHQVPSPESPRIQYLLTKPTT